MTRTFYGRAFIACLFILPLYYVLICGFLLPLEHWNSAFEQACRWCVRAPAGTYADDPLRLATTVPQWYVWPSWGMLRSITFDIGPINTKVLGIFVAGAAPATPLILAFFDWTRVPKSAWFILLAVLPVVCGLGYIGGLEEPLFVGFGLCLTATFYAIILVVFPFLAREARARKEV